MSETTKLQPYVLILAGGSGTRFWPASQRRRPKHVLPGLGGDGRTLLAATISRLLPLTRPERIFVMTAADQRDVVLSSCVALPEGQILVEPEPKSTGPAVALGILQLAQRGAGPHDAVIVLPADAYVADEEAFRATLLRASAAAKEHKTLVMLGVTPTRPETGYGWIEIGGSTEEVVGGGSGDVWKVASFVEKPDAERAAALLEGGKHLWNAGIFVFRLGYLWWLLGELNEEWDLAMTMMSACLVDGDQAGLAMEYGQFEAISFDHGVVERAPSLHCVEAEFGWSDLGSWDAVADALPSHAVGAVRADRVVHKDAARNVVFAPGKTVALLGVDDLIVVVTDGAVLVAPRARAQEVRELAAELAATGEDDSL